MTGKEHRLPLSDYAICCPAAVAPLTFYATTAATQAYNSGLFASSYTSV